MGSWNAIYLHGDVPTDLEFAVEGAVPVRKVGDWCEVRLPGLSAAEPIARALSRRVLAR